MTPARARANLAPHRAPHQRGTLRAAVRAGPGDRCRRRVPPTAKGVPTICAHEDSTGYPWCVEHDPTGTCLGEIRRLPGGGAAWLEGAGTTALRITLGRPRRGSLLQLSATQARELITTLDELATQMTS